MKKKEIKIHTGLPYPGQNKPNSLTISKLSINYNTNSVKKVSKMRHLENLPFVFRCEHLNGMGPFISGSFYTSDNCRHNLETWKYPAGRDDGLCNKDGERFAVPTACGLIYWFGQELPELKKAGYRFVKIKGSYRLGYSGKQCLVVPEEKEFF